MSAMRPCLRFELRGTWTDAEVRVALVPQSIAHRGAVLLIKLASDSDDDRRTHKMLLLEWTRSR